MKNMLGRLLSLGLALGLAGTALAQEKRPLSLAEAISLGVENSHELKISESQLREAAASRHEMQDKRLPELSVSGQYMRLNQPNVSLSPMLAGEPGAGGGGGMAAPSYLSLGQATAEMPLFAGFRIKNAVRSAQYLEEAARFDRAAQESEVRLNLVAAYLNLYKAQEAVLLMKDNLKQAQQRVQDFQNMEKNGLLARNDLLKAQLQEANIELALLDAENSRQVANYSLNLLLGLEAETTLQLDSLGDLQLPELTSLADLQQMALSRDEVQALAQREKASESAIQIAKAERWPSIGLSGGYVAADIDQLMQVTNAMNVGVGVHFSLSSLYKSGAKIHQAEEKHVQLQHQQARLNDHIRTQLYQTLGDYRESKKRLQVYEKAQAQARENYRIVNNKHQNALATTTELLDAELARYQAELNLTYARLDALLAYCQLMQQAGQIDTEAFTQFLKQ